MIQFVENCAVGGAMLETKYEAYDSAGRRKYLTFNEGSDFLKVAQTFPPRDRLFCELLFYSGVRISEALALPKDGMDKAESVILVRCLKKRGKIVTRRVPVPESLIRRLEDYSGTRPGRLWEFGRRTGWRIVKAAMRQAGIHGIQASPKGLRHGFGVRAAMANVPINIIQRWMGHAYPSTTAIYLAIQGIEERNLIARTWEGIDLGA